MASSAAPPSCLSHSNASNTRGETGGRPRVESWGNRWAQLRSIAATRATQGNGSAHGRRGWVCGTKSATWRRVPDPVNQGWRWRKRRIVRSPDKRGREPQDTTIRSASQSHVNGVNKLVATRYDVQRYDAVPWGAVLVLVLVCPNHCSLSQVATKVKRIQVWFPYKRIRAKIDEHLLHSLLCVPEVNTVEAGKE